MLLEQSMNDLCRRLAELRAALRAVQVAAGDGEPAAGIRELVAVLDSAAEAAEKARKAARLPIEIDGVRCALPRSQRQFSVLKHQFCATLNARQTLDTWQSAGREDLVYYIGRCSGPLFAAERALGTCWTRLAEYSALNPGGVMPGFFPPP
jgi:hypothetical protein